MKKKTKTKINKNKRLFFMQFANTRMPVMYLKPLLLLYHFYFLLLNKI